LKKSGSVPLCTKIESGNTNAGYFTDSRDGKEYRIVKIGKQIWMAENLNYNASGSKCYNNNPAYCEKYGRLYNWSTAKRACPVGWHLPSKAELGILLEFVNPSCQWKTRIGCAYTKTKLLATSSNGTDKYGFSALLGGYYINATGRFVGVSNYGSWWSSESGDGECEGCPKEFALYATYVEINDEDYSFMNCDDCTTSGLLHKSDLRSVRCLKD